MRTIDLYFWGYTWNDYKSQIDNTLGILLIYRGGLDSEGIPVMKELLYIGYGTINRIVGSDKWQTIMSVLHPCDMLFYSYAEVDDSVVKDVLAVLIEKGKPKINDNIQNPVEVMIKCHGSCAFLDE